MDGLGTPGPSPRMNVHRSGWGLVQTVFPFESRTVPQRVLDTTRVPTMKKSPSPHFRPRLHNTAPLVTSYATNDGNPSAVFPDSATMVEPLTVRWMTGPSRRVSHCV